MKRMGLLKKCPVCAWSWHTQLERRTVLSCMCLGWVSVVKRNKVQARAIKEKKNRQEQQDSALKSTASLLHCRGPELALHVGVATAVIGCLGWGFMLFRNRMASRTSTAMTVAEACTNPI